jgi:signal peptidase II
MHVTGPLYFTHVQNTGAVFGIGQGYILIPTIATVAILAAMPLILRHLSIHYRLVLTRLESVSLGLIAAGAVGNLIDRIFLSAVTDFMHVELAPGLYWPAFNVADMCVVSGTFLLIIAFFRRDARGAVHDDGA